MIIFVWCFRYILCIPNLFALVRGIWFLEEIFANGTEKGKGKVYLTAGLLKKNSMWDFQGLGN